MYSSQTLVSDGTVNRVDLSIEYIDKSDIQVFVDDSLLPTNGYAWTWASDTAINFNQPVLLGSVINIRRTTAYDNIKHIFEVGGAVFKDRNVDENFRQVLYWCQDFIEGKSIKAVWNNLNMHGYRIINLGAAVEPYDAVSLGQYQADAMGAWNAKRETELIKEAAFDKLITTQGYSDAMQLVLESDDTTLDVPFPDGSHIPTVAKRTVNLTSAVVSVNGMIGDVVIPQDTVSSIADLRLLATPTDGSVVQVASYYSDSLYGGGVFKYDATKVAIDDGGSIIKGWVRIFNSAPTPYMFGAKGDWDATTESGSDDSAAFQACTNYILSKPHMRAGSYHTMYIPNGNFKLTNWDIKQLQYTFGFNGYGDGIGTQLWFDRAGNGVAVDIEFIQFDSIVFNGNTVAKIDSTKPPIPYIFRFKLQDKRADIDVTFNNCTALWFNTVARVVGRGFTWHGGSLGMGNTVLEIACDEDLNIVGEVPQMHPLEAAMRHYKFSNTRTDIVSTLCVVTGTHAVKDYINGFTVSGCEFTKLNSIIQSTDCTLRDMKLLNNLAIGCFASNISSGAVDVPRAVGVQDIGNTWLNYPQETNVTTARGLGISFLYRFGSIKNFTMANTHSKDLIWGVIQAGTINGLTITGCVFSGFGDFDNTSNLIQTTNTSVPTHVQVLSNTIKSQTTKTRKWLSGSTTGLGSKSICIADNYVDSTWPVQGIQFTPVLKAGGSVTGITSSVAQAHYNVKGSECEVSILYAGSLTDSAAGVLVFDLPIPSVPINGTFGTFAGSASCGTTAGYNVPVFAEARGSNIELKSVTGNLTAASRVSANVTLILTLKYKVR